MQQNHIVNKKIIEDYNMLLSKYPNFSRNCEKIIGKLGISIEDDFVEYDIDIIIPDDYPNSLPKTFETSNKIKPKTINRHFYNDKSCCTGINSLALIHFKDGKVNLLEYVEKFVVPFLFSQTYYDYYGEWPYGEYSHGVQGVLEGYEDILNIKGKSNVILILSKAVLRKIGINRKCPCGSGRKLKDCHIKSVNLIKERIDFNTIKYHIKKIKELD